MRSERRVLRGFGWSAAYTVMTRLSTLAAVPLVLHGLGTRLYGVWVLAGSLVLIQSLFDLGAASAMVRYVAVAAAAGSREAVLSITRRTLAFYIGLSLLVSVPLWFLAGAVVDLVPFIGAHLRPEATTIVRWAAVAFALTNVVLVIGSALQGINQVAASYRAQTIGWIVYLPILAAGLATWDPSQAVGVAWVAGFGLQLLLLIPSFVRHVRRLPNHPSPVPTLRELFSFGGRWQVSAWADFATFQLPRFLVGFGLSAQDLLTLDVSIRAAQAAVAPAMAFYPVVLPRAAEIVVSEGMTALRSMLQRYSAYGSLVLIGGACALIPLEVPALSLWTGRPAASFDQLAAGLIFVGTSAHASTGLLTSAQLALGNVRSVMRYKALQLALAVILLVVAAPVGLWAVALGLTTALLVPAIIYNRRAAASLELRWPVTDRQLGPLVLIGAVATAGPGIIVVAALKRTLPAWELLAVAAAVTAPLLAVAGRLILTRFASRPQMLTTASGRLATPAHFSRK